MYNAAAVVALKYNQNDTDMACNTRPINRALYKEIKYNKSITNKTALQRQFV